MSTPQLPAAMRYLIVEIIDKYLSQVNFQGRISDDDYREIYEARNWIKDYPSPVREPKASHGEVIPYKETTQGLQTGKGLKPFTSRGK